MIRKIPTSFALDILYISDLDMEINSRDSLSTFGPSDGALVLSIQLY